MQFPAMHELTADEYNSLTIYALKSADQIVNNSATLVNDIALKATVVASGVYRFELGIRYTGSTAADLKTNWSVPSGTLMTFDILGVAGGASALAIFAWDSGSSFTFEGNAGTTAFRQTGIVKAGASAGTIQFQWAQNAATVADTKVLANSYLLLTRLA